MSLRVHSKIDSVRLSLPWEEPCDGFKLQCVVYQWFRFNLLYKLMENFFSNFEFFSNFWRNTEFFSYEFVTNSGTLFFFYLKCFDMHQWIRLNELYKLMESFFFKFQIRFRIFDQKL